MTELLLRIFIKQKDGADASSLYHATVGKLAGVVGIICNLLLTAAKIAVGAAAGSVSVIADGVNNLSDAASSIVTLVGFKLAQRPADKDHPFGHARYEYLAGTVVAALILAIGAELLISSVKRIFSPSPIALSIPVAIILFASVAVKLWLSLFYRTLGRRIASQTLLASSADSRNDVIATAAVLIGCALRHFLNIDADGFVGVIVALFIISSGIGIARDATSTLLGKKADQSLVDSIEEIIMSHEKVLGAHDLLVHDYGPGRVYASVHVEFDAVENALLCHDIIDSIEHEVLDKTGVDIVIHYDPVVENDDEQNRLTAVVGGIIEQIDPRLSVHDFRIARGAEKNRLVFDICAPYDILHDKSELKSRIDSELARRGYDYETVIRFDGK